MSVSTVGFPLESRTCLELTLRIVEVVSNSGSSEATEIALVCLRLLLGNFLLGFLSLSRFQLNLISEIRELYDVVSAFHDLLAIDDHIALVQKHVYVSGAFPGSSRLVLVRVSKRDMYSRFFILQKIADRWH